jgi:hypothetical protein
MYIHESRGDKIDHMVISIKVVVKAGSKGKETLGVRQCGLLLRYKLVLHVLT